MPQLSKKEIIEYILKGFRPVCEVRKGTYEYCYLVRGPEKIYAGPWNDEYEKLWFEIQEENDQFFPDIKALSSYYQAPLDNQTDMVNNHPLATTDELSEDEHQEDTEKKGEQKISEHKFEDKKNDNDWDTSQTFMHELGHTLGLKPLDHRGGIDGYVYTIEEYPSVMNYGIKPSDDLVDYSDGPTWGGDYDDWSDVKSSLGSELRPF